MRFASLVGYGFFIVAIVAVIALLTSRKVIERLVNLSVLPRPFLNFVPILAVAIRALAVVLIAVGFVHLGISTGILSYEWMSRYGFSTLLIAVGVLLLFITIKRTHDE